MVLGPSLVNKTVSCCGVAMKGRSFVLEWNCLSFSECIHVCMYVYDWGRNNVCVYKNTKAEIKLNKKKLKKQKL